MTLHNAPVPRFRHRINRQDNDDHDDHDDPPKRRHLYTMSEIEFT